MIQGNNNDKTLNFPFFNFFFSKQTPILPSHGVASTA